MKSRVRVGFGLLLVLTLTGRDARAQWGFDGWGWHGWMSPATAESAALQGAGYFAMGAGIYNLKTAQAESINTDTAIRFNDYVAQITRESARIYAARTNARIARNNELFAARQRQLRDNPTARDVQVGDALNAAVADLSDPRLGRSVLRSATAAVPASLIANVPFVTAAERITLMLDGLRSSIKWPDVFEGERFKADQKAFDEIAATIRKQAYEGTVDPQSLQQARQVIKELQTKVKSMPLTDPEDQKVATQFVASCLTLIDLLEKPNIGPTILELKNVKDTTIGSLLGFMHAFNLRFGVANSPSERMAYRDLFEILDKTRDLVLAETKLDEQAPATAKPSDAATFFESLERARSK